MTNLTDITSQNKDLSEWCIMSCFRGSIAHGMYVPNTGPNSIDDKDIMAVCIPPIDYYYGLKQYGSRGTREIKQDEWDIVIYEVQKMIGLLSKGNPNVLMTLWLDEKYYLLLTPAWREVISNRWLFTAKKHVFNSFVGYAHSQLKRMERHEHKGYMGQKRKQLVKKFGYDAKNAAHLIRLLRMGIEFLNEGNLYVERQDAAELLQIKRGEWELEQVKSEADKLFKNIHIAYEKCTLADLPNDEEINKLCVRVVQMAISSQKIGFITTE